MINRMFFKKNKNNQLISTSDEKAFFLHGGQVLHNLKELQEALKSMDDKTFSFHVQKGKNDFAKWIDEVLQDQYLAKRLQRIKTKRATLRAVIERLQSYYS